MNLRSIIALAFSSLMSRKGSAILTILAVAVSVMLFLSVDKLRTAARTSFENTISGTHLIVGARTSPESLVLFSVFHIGNPSANMTWESFEWLQGREDVDWAVPISLGDSHKGHRVVGTTTDFFARYKYRNETPLTFSEGEAFADLFDVVIGARVAEEQGYKLGDGIILTHGLGDVSFSGHDNLPFRIVGILEPTGTPVDQSVFVSLEAISAIHVGWESGAKSPIANMMTPDRVRGMDLETHSISAALVGLTDNKRLFLAKRSIDTYPQEALLAAIPSQAIASIWKLIGVAERALLAVSGFVILVGLVSILTAIMTSLRERRREMAVLRATGAGPHHVMFLLISESALLAALGSLFGIILTAIGLYVLAPILETRFGLALSDFGPGVFDLQVFLAVTIIAAILGIVPGWQALRNSLADGLSIKL